MPIFEYKCKQCDTKFEILHKSTQNTNAIACPECLSTETKKLFSSFSSAGSSSDFSPDNCASGNCGMDYSNMGSCSSGMCGLN